MNQNKNPDTRIWVAIGTLMSNYELAKHLGEQIKNPVAWALYQTWKEFDK